eukprot:6747810-Ditylum_brightwellii.AAC.1
MPQAYLGKTIEQVLCVIKKSTGMDIEVVLVSEAAFGDKALKDRFYKKFDSDDPEMDEQLRLRRVPTIY